MKLHNTRNRFAALGFTLCALLAMNGAIAHNITLAQGRDPFTKYKAPVRRVSKAKPVPAKPTIVEAPTIQARIDKYKEQKAAARVALQPAPKATTAMLLSELQVAGIFHTPRGYAAMVEATPIKFTYVVYPGEQFYDGQLVAIEDNRLVFRRETRWTNGRRDVVVENKDLRKPDAVTDSLATTRGNAANGRAASAEDKSKDAKTSQPEKP